MQTKKLGKYKKAVEAYLEPSQTSMMERFCKNITTKAVNYFRKYAPS